MCNLVQTGFCHIYLYNTRECEFAVRNEGITTSSPFSNDTKNCEINGLKKYPEVRGQRYKVT